MRRRDFLKGSLAAGLLTGTGCESIHNQLDFPKRKGPYMATFRAPAIGGRLRVGLIGVGARGSVSAVRLARVPGVTVTALCDVYSERISLAVEKMLKLGAPAPHRYEGTKEAWRQLCESRDVDLVYICTPWLLHTPMALYAMTCGKHVAVEMPAAVTVEQCWELVNTSEATQRHCVMLESAAYRADSLWAETLCRESVLGRILYGDVSYVNDLFDSSQRSMNASLPVEEQWLRVWAVSHCGNSYPFGAGTALHCLGINHGDRFETLATVGGISPVVASGTSSRAKPVIGDVNETTLRSYRGRTLTLRQDTASARPMELSYRFAGTRGALDLPQVRLSVGADEKSRHWLDAAEIARLRAKYVSPVLKEHKTALAAFAPDEAADALMDIRLAHCLQAGLAPDWNVYDAAMLSSIVELSENSVNRKGRPVRIPDFTRGGWVQWDE